MKLLFMMAAPRVWLKITGTSTLCLESAGETGDALRAAVCPATGGQVTSCRPGAPETAAGRPR